MHIFIMSKLDRVRISTRLSTRGVSFSTLTHFIVSMSTGAIERTLARVHKRIQACEYYEAHQAVRTVVARYVRKHEYNEAVGLLYSSCLLLARAGQYASVSDLLCYMFEVLNEQQPQELPKGRIAQVIWMLDPLDPALKEVAVHAPQSDPELAHVLGIQFSRAGLIYEAERWLLRGNRDSARALAQLHYTWGQQDPLHASLYFSRGVFGYLSVINIWCAQNYVDRMLELVPSPDKWIEFFKLLVPTCQTKDASLWRRLATHYNPSEYASWNQAISLIEQEYFDIKPQRQANLMDMMGGMFR